MEALPWKRSRAAGVQAPKADLPSLTRGDTQTVHRLQRAVDDVPGGQVLAVRRVTQDNRGKRTAGVDGKRAPYPTDSGLALARTLRLSATARPVRRVWIPKPGLDGAATAGHPDDGNRAAASPRESSPWNRSGRRGSSRTATGSARDAPATMRSRPSGTASTEAKYVLDADIAKCFDRIDHEALLEKLATFPALRRAVKAWLKAVIVDGESLFPTRRGHPPGRGHLPLLANVALHGLETAIKPALPVHGQEERGVQKEVPPRSSATRTTSWSCTRTWRPSERERSPGVARGHGAGTEAQQDPDRPHVRRIRGRRGSTSWASPFASSPWASATTGRRGTQESWLTSKPSLNPARWRQAVTTDEWRR